MSEDARTSQIEVAVSDLLKQQHPETDVLNLLCEPRSNGRWHCAYELADGFDGEMWIWENDIHAVGL